MVILSGCEEVRESRERLVSAGYPIPAVETMSRYQWVDEVLNGVVVQPAEEQVTITDRIDQVGDASSRRCPGFRRLHGHRFPGDFFLGQTVSRAD